MWLLWPSAGLFLEQTRKQEQFVCDRASISIRAFSCILRDTQDTHLWHLQILLYASIEGPGWPSAKGLLLTPTFIWLSSHLRPHMWLSSCHSTVCHHAGLGPPFSSFSHPQLSSPLLLFSSLVKHILYLLALSPKSLLLALASLLSIF